MCACFRWLADRKASQIESKTTSRQLILVSPHEHCCSSPPKPLPMPLSSHTQPKLETPSSFYNCTLGQCRGAQVRGSSWGRVSCVFSPKWDEGVRSFAQVIHQQTGQLWSARRLAAGEKWTADVGRAQPQHARWDKELSAPPRPPSIDPCHPKALSSSNPAGAKANFPLWLSRGWALWNCRETCPLRSVQHPLSDWCIQGPVMASQHQGVEDLSYMITVSRSLT